MDRPTIGDPLSLWLLSVGRIRAIRRAMRAAHEPIPASRRITR